MALDIHKKRIITTAVIFLLIGTFVLAWALTADRLMTRETWGWGTLIWVTPLALIMILSVIFGPRFQSYMFTWELFSSKYQPADFPGEGLKAEGFGIIDNKIIFDIQVAVNTDGIFIENAFANSRPQILLPWSGISRLDSGTLILFKDKPCEPKSIAYLYLWRNVSNRITMPWNPVFNNYVPSGVALNEIGNVQLH